MFLVTLNTVVHNNNEIKLFLANLLGNLLNLTLSLLRSMLLYVVSKISANKRSLVNCSCVFNGMAGFRVRAEVKLETFTVEVLC